MSSCKINQSSSTYIYLPEPDGENNTWAFRSNQKNSQRHVSDTHVDYIEPPRPFVVLPQKHATVSKPIHRTLYVERNPNVSRNHAKYYKGSRPNTSVATNHKYSTADSESIQWIPIKNNSNLSRYASMTNASPNVTVLPQNAAEQREYFTNDKYYQMSTMETNQPLNLTLPIAKPNNLPKRRKARNSTPYLSIGSSSPEAPNTRTASPQHAFINSNSNNSNTTQTHRQQTQQQFQNVQASRNQKTSRNREAQLTAAQRRSSNEIRPFVSPTVLSKGNKIEAISKNLQSRITKQNNKERIHRAKIAQQGNGTMSGTGHVTGTRTVPLIELQRPPMKGNEIMIPRMAQSLNQNTTMPPAAAVIEQNTNNVTNLIPGKDLINPKTSIMPLQLATAPMSTPHYKVITTQSQSSIAPLILKLKKANVKVSEVIYISDSDEEDEKVESKSKNNRPPNPQKQTTNKDINPPTQNIQPSQISNKDIQLSASTSEVLQLTNTPNVQTQPMPCVEIITDSIDLNKTPSGSPSSSANESADNDTVVTKSETNHTHAIIRKEDVNQTSCANNQAVNSTESAIAKQPTSAVATSTTDTQSYNDLISEHLHTGEMVDGVNIRHKNTNLNQSNDQEKNTKTIYKYILTNGVVPIPVHDKEPKKSVSSKIIGNKLPKIQKAPAPVQDKRSIFETLEAEWNGNDHLKESNDKSESKSKEANIPKEKIIKSRSPESNSKEIGRKLSESSEAIFITQVKSSANPKIIQTPKSLITKEKSCSDKMVETESKSKTSFNQIIDIEQEDLPITKEESTKQVHAETETIMNTYETKVAVEDDTKSKDKRSNNQMYVSVITKESTFLSTIQNISVKTGLSSDVNMVSSPSQDIQKNQNERKLFHCNHHGCNYTTARSRQLNKHRRGHSNNKHYKCPICSYGYNLEWTFNKHMKTHEAFDEDIDNQTKDRNFEIDVKETNDTQNENENVEEMPTPHKEVDDLPPNVNKSLSDYLACFDELLSDDDEMEYDQSLNESLTDNTLMKAANHTEKLIEIETKTDKEEKEDIPSLGQTLEQNKKSSNKCKKRKPPDLWASRRSRRKRRKIKIPDKL